MTPWRRPPHRTAGTDEPEGVVGRGPRSDLGSERTLVLAADRPIVTIGLRDIIVVDAGDVILVAAAAASQEVKVAAEAWATRPTGRPASVADPGSARP